MMIFTEEEIDRLIVEDVPYFDLTTQILSIGDVSGEIVYQPRHSIVVSCTEEAVRIFKKLGAVVEFFVPTGTFLEKGEPILKAKGKLDALHIGWRVVQILLEYSCGIATRTRKIVNLAKGVNPEVQIVTTRKNFPGGKKISVKSVIAGGALPHRLGLSETVLIFAQHIKFLGRFEKLLKLLPDIKQKAPEKKITVEVESVDMAEKVLRAGADIVQLDKFSYSDVGRVVSYRNEHYPESKIAAAGGINIDNVAEYAKTGVDLLVLSYPFFGKPADIKVSFNG